MSELLNINKDYRAWVETIKKRYKQSQTRAVLKANQEMMSFYWQLGKDIVEMRVEEQWGKKSTQEFVTRFATRFARCYWS